MGLIDRWRAKRLAKARLRAVEAVRACSQEWFSWSGPDVPDEGPWTVAKYRYVEQHPGEFYMCAVDGCPGGPWHSGWAGTHRRLRALGSCCSGAD